MEPERHLAFAEGVRLALAEPQLAFGDRLIAALGIWRGRSKPPRLRVPLANYRWATAARLLGVRGALC
jgi:hypothetical protein